MMKKTYFLLAALAGIAIWGCKNDEVPTYPEYDLVLVSPDNGASIDLALNPTVSFGYNEAPGITMYVLMLSRSEDMADAQNILITTNPQLFTTEELDARASALNIAKGETATVYWSVRPNSGAYNIKTQVRSFQLSRVATPLQYPIDGQVHVTVSYPDAAEPGLTFEWHNRDNAQAELIVSTTADLSDGVTIYSGATSSKAFTHAELQSELINHATLGLKRYFKNTLYWNVKIGGTFIGEVHEQFFLSGQQVLVDVRGDETMVYPVAVIEEDGYNAVWMGQDLKTLKYYDGTSIASAAALFPPPAGDPVYSVGLVTAVAPGDNPKQGYLYSPQYGSFLAGGADTDPNFIPAGWVIPVKEDYDALYNAALTIGGSVDVLKDPVAYNNDSFGAWGLNFYVAGYVDGGVYVYEPYGWYNLIIQLADGWTYWYNNTGRLMYRCGTVRFKYSGN